jgi:hypothetical protein
MILYLTDINFDLGNSRLTTNLAEAASIFMQREFEEICKHASEPHQILFVPERYLFHSLTSKVTPKFGCCRIKPL